MTSVAAKILSLAHGEVGYHEGRAASGSWNNDQKYSEQVPGLEWSDYQAWCQTFQSWLALKGGSASYEPRTASCRVACDWFKQRGRFSEYPAIGAQVFFGANGGTHVGRVWKYDADYIWTVEGNTNENGSAQGDGVYSLKHARRSSRVYGYGLPAFPEGIVTADPALKGKAGYTYVATADKPAGTVPPAPKPSAPKPKPVALAPFPGAAWFKRSPRSPLITAMGRRLVAEGYRGYKSGPGPQWTDADKAAYAWFQRKLGYSGSDADGWPGAGSWAKLRVPKS